jgi:hypothetical protein
MSTEIDVQLATSHRSGRVATTATDEGFNWPLVFLAFVVIAAIAVGKAIYAAHPTPLLNDTDDAMRMVTVRDLLAGQSWFDHTQYRLNTPYGAQIHWSHIVDAGIGAVILLFRPFAGAFSETLAAYVWPLLLLLPMLILSAKLAFRLIGRAAILPSLILPVLSPAVIPEFSPGRLDHDSIQMLLLLAMLWGAVESLERPRFAWAAGLAAALALAIGIEGLPSAISAMLAFAFIWVARPERAAAMRNFGLSFAAGTIALLMEAYPPAQWFAPACDEISIVYAAFAAGVGVVLAALSLLPLGTRAPWQRLLVGACLGAALGVALAVAFPLCLKGPYAALDPWLVTNWLDHVSEAIPLMVGVRAFDPFAIGVGVSALLALATVGVRVIRGPQEGRGEWLILGLFLTIAMVVMYEEIRGARLIGVLIAPAGAWLIVSARRLYLSRRRVIGGIGIVIGWIGFAALPITVATALVKMEIGGNNAATAANATAACGMPQAFDELAALPQARLMTQVDLGSHALLFTKDSVVGAPYHRDQSGVLDTFHFFDGPISQARGILAARGVSLVVVCPNLPETKGPPDASPDSFVKLFAEGKLPGWLSEISTPAALLKIYRVLPQ